MYYRHIPGERDKLLSISYPLKGLVGLPSTFGQGPTCFRTTKEIDYPMLKPSSRVRILNGAMSYEAKVLPKPSSRVGILNDVTVSVLPCGGNYSVTWYYPKKSRLVHYNRQAFYILRYMKERYSDHFNDLEIQCDSTSTHLCLKATLSWGHVFVLCLKLSINAKMLARISTLTIMIEIIRELYQCDNVSKFDADREYRITHSKSKSKDFLVYIQDGKKATQFKLLMKRLFNITVIKLISQQDGYRLKCSYLNVPEDAIQSIERYRRGLLVSGYCRTHYDKDTPADVQNQMVENLKNFKTLGR